MTTTTRAQADAGVDVGTWSPLRNRLFAVLLVTHLFTQLAAFMNGLAGAWVLTDITDSPAVVASLLFAVALPTFLLALFAGALADVASRKRIILVAQSGSVLVTGAFALLAATDSHTSASVLGLTAALGFLTALAAPAWVAIIPGLVHRSELAGAMTLSSAATSGSQAVGPALAGAVIAIAGPTWVFALNALVFVATFGALRTWKPAPRSGLPAEHLLLAVRTGFQYVRYDRPLKVVIGKILPYAVTTTALVSLLPAVARFRLDAGPAMFGLLSGAGGIGAIIALLLMPRLRQRFGPDAIVLGAMVANAVALVGLATTTSLGVAFAVLVVAGAATLAAVATVMVVLQMVLPAWVRGRGVAVYLLALQGAFAAGALLWGAVAEETSLRTALIVAGVVMAVSAVPTRLLRLSRYAEIDVDTPWVAADVPAVTSVHDHEGPILLTAHWRIDPSRRDRVVAAMRPVRRALKQKGVLDWHLVEDVSRPGHLLESFSVATWSEYQRLLQRGTTADEDVHRALEEAAGVETPPLEAHKAIKVGAR